MKKAIAAIVALSVSVPITAFAGEAEIRDAQSIISRQIDAFLAGDNERAYSFASPGIKRLFPTVEAFMNMVTRGYQPVWKPQSYTFGKSSEPSATTIMQQLLVVGPDGKNYEAVYTLELQPDGTYRITSVSLRESTALST